jgi:hypothetical protein
LNPSYNPPEIEYDVAMVALIELAARFGRVLGLPPEDVKHQQMTELLARSLVAQLIPQGQVKPGAILENLAQENVTVKIKTEGKEIELRNHHDLRTFSEHFPEPLRPRTICIFVPGFGEFCWTVRYLPRITA